GTALEQWQAEYEESWKNFQQSVMAVLRPFSASNLDVEFFRMFDSIDVVPMQHIAHYETLILSGKYLEAAGWHVSIAWRDYARLEKMGRAWRDTVGRHEIPIYVVKVPYSSDKGLDLYGVYASQDPASHPPTTPLDDYDVPMEAD